MPLHLPDRGDHALLVIDVQNDYCHQAGALSRGAGFDVAPIQAAVPVVQDLIAAARAAAVPVLFVRTQHDRWTDSPTWLGRSVRQEPICVTGSWGAEFYRVRPEPGDCVVIKHRYSAFVDTNLELILRSLGRRTLVLAGFTANVCVESTARDGCMKDYRVVLAADATAAPTRFEYDAALHNIGRYFGQVAEAASIREAWGA